MSNGILGIIIYNDKFYIDFKKCFLDLERLNIYQGYRRHVFVKSMICQLFYDGEYIIVKY